MTPVPYAEVARRHPQLVSEVLAKLDHYKPGIAAAEVDWYLVVCHDDPDQPLDEAACADVMLTGTLPCRNGVCGKFAGHFGCACEDGRMGC